ncbi:MAG TPA: endo-1,4-beta-xylanase [Pirellulales bacterium]|nr:endo-1,4-beta-xylanase [Pirellulales bacterium]
MLSHQNSIPIRKLMPTGSLRLVVPPTARFSPRLAEQAYMAGPDQIPWPCRTRLMGGELIVERGVADSGKFHMPWPVEGHGELMLSTATLMERDRPYQLLVELARGKVNQVRNQIADWQTIGLAVSAKVEAAIHKAVETLARAVTSQHDIPRATELADRAIVLAHDAADLLVSSYADQALAVRHRHDTKLKTLLGANLGQERLAMPLAAYYLKAFNTAQVPLTWRTIEAGESAYQWDLSDEQFAACQEHGLAVCGGPLVRLDAAALPDWIYLWEDDFASLQSFISDFVEKTVTRYRGRVHLWQCAARLNVASGVSLSEEQKLRLAVRAIEVTRSIDPHTPLVVRFDQPWAEYMGRTAPDFSPLHFADALVRSHLPISAVGIEINMGYQPGGSYPRDRLEFSRLIDLWSYLGLPLQLTLTVPSGERAEPAGRGRAVPMAGMIPGGWSPENQAAWIKHYLPMLLAKPTVQAIFWNQLCDAEGAELPFGGLFDAAGSPKPGVAALTALRRKHLG